MLKSDIAPSVGRWVVFGSMAAMGSVLALAQVTAPPEAPGAKGAKDRAAPVAPREDQAQPRRPAERDRPAADRPAGADAQPARRPGLGIEFDAQAREGLSITTIQPESLAAEAGLRAGDRFVTVDGRTFTTPRQLQAYLGGQFGRRIPVVIDRGGQQYNVYLDMGQPGDDAAWLGVFLQESERQQPGAQITQVYPAGPAARAGLRPGDVIQQVNQKPVTEPAELIGLIEEMKPGAKVELAVLRGQQQVTIPAVLGNRSHFVFYGGGQGNRSGEGQQFDEDEFGNIPAYAMQLEHDRRMAEQHQRMEEELRKLTEEVRKLREALQPRAN
ncbi:MAG TPA: PDZ domain-containing protein [Pirellulaceae bacterium]|nr:PDZ domain-containing protein [Pirellulaceae bacterium]